MDQKQKMHAVVVKSIGGTGGGGGGGWLYMFYLSLCYSGYKRLKEYHKPHTKPIRCNIPRQNDPI